MRYSILIVNWRTSDLLRRLIVSLEQYPAAGSSEIIVVDNAGGDFDSEAFTRDFPNITFLPQKDNLGFAGGNNLAYQHASGENIILLNPDTEVTEGALETLLSFLEQHPKAAIAAPQLILPGGKVQDSCRSFPWPTSIVWTALKMHKLFPKSKLFGAYRMTWFNHQYTLQVDQPMASCWAVPRRVINEIGLFDEDFRNLFNDVDWCWRAKRAGWEIWFVAEARVKHVGGQGTQQARERMFGESHRGLLRFYNKNLRGHSPAAALGLGKCLSAINCIIRTWLEQRSACLHVRNKHAGWADVEIPAEASIDVSVCIVNWNTREDLLTCLGSFVPEGEIPDKPGSTFLIDGCSCEVFVVDNFSEDGSAEAVEKMFPAAHVLRQDTNTGFAAGNNRAFSISRGRYLLTLNPDTIVHPKAISALMTFADNHPQAAVVGPKVLNQDGSIQHSARKFPTLAAGLFRNSILDRIFPNNKFTRDYLQSNWDHADPREVDWLSGCALLLRRSSACDLKGFDEDYYMYVEDMDICWRAHKAGWGVWFCPSAEITHKKARASDLIPNRMIYQHHRSMYTFFKKHYCPTANIPERIIVPIGLFMRASYFIAKNKFYKWIRGRR